MALASSGITTALVGNTLGTTSRDVGALCTNSSINEWSVWKPIASTATTLTYSILENANFGINIISATTPSALLTNVTNNSNLGYVYNKPTNRYRLGDFRNYDHTASIPLFSLYEDGDTVNIGGVSTAYTQGVEGIEQMTPDDLTSSTYLTKGHLYPSDATQKGVLITDGTNTSWSVGNIPWGNTYWQRFKGKSCTALEFLTNLSSGTTFVGHTASADDRFYAIPYPLHTITVSSTAPAGSKTVFVDGTFEWTDTSYTAVSYNFCFSSIGDVYAGGTLNNVYIGLYSDSKGTNVLYQKKLETSITVGSETTSISYIGTLTSSQATMGTYVGIYWNYSLQYVTQAFAMPDEGLLPLE